MRRGGSARAARYPTGLVASLAVVSFLAAFPLAPLHFATGETPPLTNQEIVRMVASGMATDRILARIAESRCSFDLDPEMIAELRVAGVPEAVVEAMKGRAPSGAPASPGAKPGSQPRGWVEIAFDDDPGLEPAANSTEVPAIAVDPNSKTRHPVELAFVLTCDRPDHVPDFWDESSPLGSFAGRHQVLFFQAATSAPDERKKGRPRIYLPHPAAWKFEVDAGQHRGFVAVAGRAVGEGKYAPIVAAAYATLVVAEGRLTRMKIRLRSVTMRTGSRADSEHPVLSSPGMTNIGSTARTDVDIKATITVVEVTPPE